MCASQPGHASRTPGCAKSAADRAVARLHGSIAGEAPEFRGSDSTAHIGLERADRDRVGSCGCRGRRSDGCAAFEPDRGSRARADEYESRGNTGGRQADAWCWRGTASGRARVQRNHGHDVPGVGSRHNCLTGRGPASRRSCVARAERFAVASAMGRAGAEAVYSRHGEGCRTPGISGSAQR